MEHETWSKSFVQKTTVSFSLHLYASVSIQKTEDGVTTTAYDMGQALDVRDSLAQLIYEELFHWVLGKISHQFKCRDSTACISVVDVYGFEVLVGKYSTRTFCLEVQQQQPGAVVYQYC